MHFLLRSKTYADPHHYSLVDGEGERLTKAGENNHRENILPASCRAHQLPYKTFFFTLLGLNVLVLIAGVVIFRYVAADEDEILGFDPPGYIPQTFTPRHIPTRYVKFLPNSSFSNIVEEEKNSPWEDLLPPGRGFIQIAEPAKYGLSGGFPTPWEDAPHAESWAISMFHQLHCVRSIKTVFLSLLPSEYGTHSDIDPGGFEGYPPHLIHCFDYLRQAIMCSGDLTLEKGDVINGKVSTAVNGWGNTHKCRDWDTMFQWAAENQGENNITSLLRDENVRWTQ